MTENQKRLFKHLVTERFPCYEFHHGDCIGADAEAHDMVQTLCPNAFIHIHPPDFGGKRAWRNGVVHAPRQYLKRNRDIVDSCDILFAFPKENHEVVRSGTWATVRYATKKKKNVIIVYPWGELCIHVL